MTHYTYYYQFDFMSVIHLHTVLFRFNRHLDGNVLWNVSFLVTIIVISVCFSWALETLVFNIRFYLAAPTLCS